VKRDENGSENRRRRRNARVGRLSAKTKRALTFIVPDPSEALEKSSRIKIFSAKKLENFVDAL